MNNPYRARPGKPRVDHAAVTNYGVQNQNSWSPMSASTQQGIPQAGSFPTQHQIANQPKQTGDPWDWGTENADNGNDSWNWSVDQQSDTQQKPQQTQQPQQQQKQQPQQPQFASPYSSPQNSQQETYYQNLNGNNRPPTNQVHPTNQAHPVDQGSNRRSRESTPQQSDGYTNYTNYNANQPQAIPPRSIPTKTSNPLISSDHSQWTSTQPQQQQQQQLQQPPQMIETLDRSPAAFNPYFQANPSNFDSKNSPAASQQSNNYNWNNPDGNRAPQSQNWQNHTEVSAPSSGYWQDNASSEIHYQNTDWQSRNAQNAQGFPIGATTNAWQSHSANRENESSNAGQQQIPSSHANVGPGTWNQSSAANASQNWQQSSKQTEVTTGQWSKQQSLDSTGNIPEGTSEEDVASRRVSSKEWTQIKPALAHFASSTASTTSGSIPNLSSSADPNDERKKSLATSIASSASLNDSPTEGKPPGSYQSPAINDRGNWIPASETNSISDNSENVQSRDNNDADWNADGDWSSARPIAELSSSIGQLSLGSGVSSQQHEIQTGYLSSQQISTEEPGIAQTTMRTFSSGLNSALDAGISQVTVRNSPGNTTFSSSQSLSPGESGALQATMMNPQPISSYQSGQQITSAEIGATQTTMMNPQMISSYTSEPQIPSGESGALQTTMMNPQAIPSYSSDQQISPGQTSASQMTMRSSQMISSYSSKQQILPGESGAAQLAMRNPPAVSSYSSGQQILSGESGTSQTTMRNPPSMASYSSGQQIPSGESGTSQTTMRNPPSMASYSSGQQIPSGEGGASQTTMRNPPSTASYSSGQQIPSGESGASQTTMRNPPSMASYSSGQQIPSGESGASQTTMRNPPLMSSFSSGQQIPTKETGTPQSTVRNASFPNSQPITASENLQPNPSYTAGQPMCSLESGASPSTMRNPLENAEAETTLSPELSVHSTYQVNSPGSTEIAPQTNYDQWYNQTSSQSQQISTSWYANNRGSQQWNAEQQNVENYENIQQSGEFVNLEVVTPVIHERDIYGSRDSINRETLENDPKPVSGSSRESVTSVREARQDVSNVEIPQTIQQTEQTPDNYEFASNDRNTFLETGELTDSHQEHESTPPSQDDENDEVPSDIPFLREVPGQSSSGDPRRNDPTGQEHQVQSSPRVNDPRRNDPTGQAQLILGTRNLSERSNERRDVPSGQERHSSSGLVRGDNETLERRNDPSGRERSLPPTQSRNDPSGEERAQTLQTIVHDPTELREIPGSGTNSEESPINIDGGVRQIPGGASPNEVTQIGEDRSNERVVTGSQEVGMPVLSTSLQDQPNESRSKREEAVGASVGETPSVLGPSNHRDSYEDGDDEGSGNSRDESRERRRDASPTDRRRYEREYEDGYYYDRRRGPDYDRAYNSREDLDRRDTSYREPDRRHNSRDDLDRHTREDPERRGRPKDDVDERDGRRRIDDRRRVDEPRRRDRDPREYDPRYPREYPERRRDERRPRRYDDYETREPPSRRDYYEDPYARSSRPSSRSSYNDRERDYYMRARDPYYGYNGYNGYDYGANYNANYYTYLENLRRTNPAAYAEWYHKYYANQHQQQVARGVAPNYQEDRASVHSGRSSCEDRTTTSEKRTLGDISVLEDSRIVSSRLTPTKFSTSHVVGSLSIGSLLHVHACYPADGDRAKVDILRLDYHLAHDPVARELRAYPGPLIKQVGVTHKKTIIEYCESKIKKAAVNDELVDRASYILLYELMIMLIQQNGNVVGVDIAQLLLRNKEAYPYNLNRMTGESVRRESTISQRSGGTGGDGSVHEGSIIAQETMEISKQRKTVEQMTDEFRNTLLYGLVQEALEYAMTEGLWGHALFLASKLDKRTHASVMTRFANSLPVQDPLQTLYQLHSGRVPASVTCVSDPKWDDWRPHLAMIISNTSANPEINRRAITNLGDTLGSRGDIHAAHFCYILAQIDFGEYGTPGVKLVLIGSNHQRSYEEFVTPEAIMLTEIYEYARHLSEPGFTLVNLQTFKFESARKMVDYGLMEKSLLYLEQIAVNIVNDPLKYKASFVNDVYTLGDRIKYHDPVCKDSQDDAASLTWLNNLAEIVDRCQNGEIPQDPTYVAPNVETQNYPTERENLETTDFQRETVRRETYNDGPISMMEVPVVDELQSQWQPLSLPSNVQDPYTVPDQSSHYPVGNVENSHYQQNQQQDYWNQQNYPQQDYQNQDYTAGDWQQQQQSQSHYQNEQTDGDVSQQQPTWNYEPAPSISMGPSSGKQYDPLKELEALEGTPRDSGKTNVENKKNVDKGTEKKTANGGSSWFGGLFSKLAPKPKNQMILPDDNNPTIIWDPVAKKWENKDENSSESGPSSLAPPPKASDMGFKPPQMETSIVQQQQQTPQLNASLDPSAAINNTKLVAGSNMFKLPKGRNMRANYIDVMNPTGSKTIVTNSTMPTPATSPLVPMAASSPQLFVPAPVTDSAAPADFLTPVTAGTPAALGDNANQGGPMMYDPADVKDRSMKNASRNRYPPR